MKALSALLRLPRLAVGGTRLALAQIWQHKVRSLLTALGIIIGVAGVCGVAAALTGLEAIVLSDFEKVGASRLGVNSERPWKGPERFLDWDLIRFRASHVDGMMEHCPSLASMTRVTEASFNVRHGDNVIEGASVTGIDPDWHDVTRRYVKTGRPFCAVDSRDKRRVCLVTALAADKLKLERDCVGETILVDSRPFAVVGIVEPGPEYALANDDGSNRSVEVFVPFETLYIEETSGLGLDALARSPELAQEAASKIRFFLRRKRGMAPELPDTFAINTAEGNIESFRKISSGAMLLSVVAVSLSLLVGGVSVMNIMLVSVTERTREIGLRKALGAHPAEICLQFLVESIVLCVVGGAAGLALGNLAATALRAVPVIDFSRAAVPLWAAVASVSLPGIAGLLFGVLPAIDAARMDPISALRHG